VRLAELIKQRLNIDIRTDSLFDIHVKRIHEYKRQLLNVLHVITLYNRMRQHPERDYVARTIVFAGKAAPGYFFAKCTIKLINAIADIVNHDPVIGDKLKVAFLPNYNVSLAEIIMPACDLSEQISTAGTEASGTGNMKFALNGALTIGTLDGANVEMLEEVGQENMFIFGLSTGEIQQLQYKGYSPWDHYYTNQELKQALDMISEGYFSPREPDLYKPITNALTHGGDKYLVLADYADYIRCQEQVSELYRDSQTWAQKALLNTANMGKFSSDRAIREYAKEVWNTSPVQVRENAKNGIK